MAYRCWTCGATVDSWRYTCDACHQLPGLSGFRKSAEAHIKEHAQQVHGDPLEQQCLGVRILQAVQQESFHTLAASPSVGLATAASAIEWGFGEIEWRLQQQSNVLQSIDYTLKTPSQTQANEWRGMAEELRCRGVLDEAEEFYLKALDTNRLDYRIYVGLAVTYLQRHQFEQARAMLQRSLPHAPVQPIDYKSYSYRLIGHIEGCAENYQDALVALQQAVQLSPNYADGYYDYAQYAALVGAKEQSLASLRKALGNPLYYSLAQQERNLEVVRPEVCSLLFRIALTGKLPSAYHAGMLELAKYWAQVGNARSSVALLEQLISRDARYFYRLADEQAFLPIRSEVQNLLKRINANARQHAETAIQQAQERQHAVHEAITALFQTLETDDPETLYAHALYQDAEVKLAQAGEKVASGDYAHVTEAAALAGEALELSRLAGDEADREREKLTAPAGKQPLPIKSLWYNITELGDIILNIMFLTFIWGVLFAMLGYGIALFIAIPWSLFFGLIFVGMLVGLGIGLKEEGWRLREFFR